MKKIEKNQLIKSAENSAFGVIKKINTVSVNCLSLSGNEFKIRIDDVITDIPVVYTFNDTIEEATLSVMFEETTREWVVTTLSGVLVEGVKEPVKFNIKYYPENDIKDTFNNICAELIRLHTKHALKKKGAQPVEMKEWGTSEAFEVVQVDSTKSVEEQYHDIMNNITSTTRAVAETADLANIKELEGLFTDARKNLEQYSKVSAKNTSGFWGKLSGAEKTKQAILVSIADNIDHMFGVINSKFDSLIDTGEKLQKIKLEMQSQMDALEHVLEASNAHIAEFEANNEMIPIRVLSTNSQIKGSYETYKAKLLKIESGIMITTGAVISLGARLPAMKAGIFDEAAYSTLLSNVNGVHDMIKTASDLMLNIADVSSEQIYNKVEQIMTHEVNDNSMIKYLENREAHTNKLAAMVQEKSTQLHKRYVDESLKLTQIANDSLAGTATRQLKILNAKK